MGRGDESESVGESSFRRNEDGGGVGRWDGLVEEVKMGLSSMNVLSDGIEEFIVSGERVGGSLGMEREKEGREGPRSASGPASSPKLLSSRRDLEALLAWAEAQELHCHSCICAQKDSP